MTSTTLNHVIDASREHYQRHGYALLPGVLPEDLLMLCRRMINLWVDYKAHQWLAEGLITDLREDLGFRERFNVLWLAAGKPSHNRSPRAELMRLDPRCMFSILSHPALTAIAAGILQSDDIVTHGVWNSRPKAPNASLTDTPWHQDAQYFTDQAAIHTMTLWFPLHEVDRDGSCLAVAPGCHELDLQEGVQSTTTGYIAIGESRAAQLPEHAVAMKAGDALVFPQRMPHRALANRGNLMRWSMDMRYVTLADATPAALALGHVSRSGDPTKLTSFEDWLKKWDNAPTW